MASTLPFLFLVLLFFLLLHPSSSALLRPGESISGNQTLTSGSGTFVLGFFSPSGFPSTSFLGVWCRGSDVRTAVWVANRRAPVPLARAVFRLSNSSNLEVADSNGTLLWSSGTQPSHPETTVAVLLDTGNLVLQREGGAGEILWQGFDHPTDTVLPGMPIWGNYQTHNSSIATSWRSPEDPSPGDFHLMVDPDTRFQGIIKRGSAKWWRGNVWSGVSFSTEGGSRSDTVVPYLAFTSSANSWNISFSSSNTLPTAWRLEHNGTAIIRVWIPSDQTWQTVYTFNAVPCESYGLCGPFGYCSPVPPTCRCLDGFEPRNRSEWDGGDGRGGCVRTQALTCDGRDELVKFQKMKLPDYNVYLKEAGNGSACMEACRSNCSCMAYAYADMWTGSATVPRCLVWVTELLDLVARNYAVARDNGAGEGEDLYVRVHVPTSGNKKSVKVVVIVPIVAGVAFLAAAVSCLLWRRRRSSGDHPRNWDEEGRLAFEVADGGGDRIRTLNTGGEADRQALRDVPMLDYETVLAATDNFSDHNMIGRGGFGIVYKGKLPGGQEVAIKRLSEESTQGVLEFKNEVVLIAQLQHRNLVKLLSCCVHGEEKLLIYEYMPNKSLELLLFDSENERVLDWTKRFNIIKGIARGVRYLHEDSRLKIIHRDLKLSNILLDGDMNPKVSDFGMARIFGGGQNHANTVRVVGTYGYISPEYAMEGLFSAKSDVYSFGVLLLEIVSSQRNTSFLSNATFPSLLSYAWDCWNGGDTMQMIADPSMRDSCTMQEVVRCVHIGLLCVQDDAAHRPNMRSVVFMLENETPIDAAPSRPSFTGWSHQDDTTNRFRNSEEAFSVSNLSISALVGR